MIHQKIRSIQSERTPRQTESERGSSVRGGGLIEGIVKAVAEYKRVRRQCPSCGTNGLVLVGRRLGQSPKPAEPRTEVWICQTCRYRDERLVA
jgi:hypothetical protein